MATTDISSSGKNINNTARVSRQSFRFLRLVGNKAKGQISKRVFQENKARQIFRKNEHF